MEAKKEEVKKDGKSGLKRLEPGEILFHEKEIAQSLFIIQSGQIRLFLSKGRGFVDIAILRAGEVIGEMAYFDEKSRQRSCSAAAIVTTQVIEISFPAFAKTMNGLNPWFKTIINTLANRLRATNNRVKELESSSVGFGKDGKVSNYVFMHNSDIVKILSALYLISKSHGEVKDGGLVVSKDLLKFYAFDIFNIAEIKWEELLNLFKMEHIIDYINNGSAIRIYNIKSIKELLSFFNTQRKSAEDKKIKISNKCERILKSIINQINSIEIPKEKSSVMVNLTTIFDDFKKRNIPLNIDDLEDAITNVFMEEVVVAGNNLLTSEVYHLKLKKIFPCITMTNAIEKLNESKTKEGKY